MGHPHTSRRCAFAALTAQPHTALPHTALPHYTRQASSRTSSSMFFDAAEDEHEPLLRRLRQLGTGRTQLVVAHRLSTTSLKEDAAL